MLHDNKVISNIFYVPSSAHALLLQILWINAIYWIMLQFFKLSKPKWRYSCFILYEVSNFGNFEGHMQLLWASNRNI